MVLIALAVIHCCPVLSPPFSRPLSVSVLPNPAVMRTDYTTLTKATYKNSYEAMNARRESLRNLNSNSIYTYTVHLIQMPSDDLICTHLCFIQFNKLESF